MPGFEPFRGTARLFLGAPRCEAWCAHGNSGCEYQIAWSINPHMRIGSTDAARALRQHDTLRAALVASGAAVEVFPFVHGAFDSVFAKDNAVLLHRDGMDHALLARPRPAERRREQAARAAMLAAFGFRIHAPPDEFLEGGDVVVRPEQRGAFLGHGFRSELGARSALESFLEAEVVPLELCDPRLYHLDTALAVLPDGVALACVEAFTPSSMRALERATDGNVIRVARAQALSFALNMVAVGETIFVAAGPHSLESCLRERGWSPVVLPLTEFLSAGGSVGCLVSAVHQQEHATRRDPTQVRSTAA